jgi:hypothetical protein
MHPFGPTVGSVRWTSLVVSEETPVEGGRGVLSAEALARGLEDILPEWTAAVGISGVSPGLMADVWKQMVSDGTAMFADPRPGFMDFPMRSNNPVREWSEGPERSLEFGWQNYP